MYKTIVATVYSALSLIFIVYGTLILVHVMSPLDARDVSVVALAAFSIACGEFSIRHSKD